MTKTQFYKQYQLYPYSINELFYFDAFCDMYIGLDDEPVKPGPIHRDKERTLHAV